MAQTDVLVVGAGPTGMVLALWLARQGVRVRIVERLEAAGTTSRALAVQARTLELYRQAGLADAVARSAHVTRAANLWARGRRAARIEFGAAGRDVTPYPFLLIYPQDEHEALLERALADAGVRVERGWEVTAVRDLGGHVTATLRSGAGQTEVVEATYACGCDGAHSVVRETMGTGFPGGTYPQLFYVADVEAEGPAVNGELHVDLDESDFLAVFPIAAKGRVRLVGTVRDERATAEALRWADVDGKALASMGFTVTAVNWFSTYRVHHRVSSDFGRGRLFILGDAAHIHSPAGGQGMNTGIGDAINLAWKLAAAVRGGAGEALLATYEEERMRFARRLVETTDRAFSFATAEGPVADALRTRLAPAVIARAMGMKRVREFAFRTVSQITLDYRGCTLSEGRAGQVQGGDRLPWAKGAASDNLAPLSRMGWQLHCYGTPPAEVANWHRRTGVAMHVFPFEAAHKAAGLADGAAYLLRPDSYVALADPKPTAAAFERYFGARGIRVAG